jgi:hypothetical protein
MSTTKTQTTNLRPALRTAYLYVVDNWAVDASDIAKATKTDVKDVNKLLKRLERTGLLASTHVNGEKALTWQSYYDVQNGEKRSDAIADFNKAFPAKQPVAAGRTGVTGATGPRYTEEQLTQAEKMRADGSTFKAIGAALGIKATAYLAKVLARREAERAAAKRSRGRKSTTKVEA